MIFSLVKMGVAGVASESWGIMGRSEDVLRRTFRKQMFKNNEPSAASLRRVNRRQVPVKNNGGLGTIPIHSSHPKGNEPVRQASRRSCQEVPSSLQLQGYESNEMKDPPGGPSGRLAV